MSSLAIAPIACADDVQITGAKCASNVRVVAHDARLSDVLDRLAHAHDFKLSFKSDVDPRVDFDGMGDVGSLVARLVPQGNVTIATARSSHCPERPQVTMVWVLPGTRQEGSASAQAHANRRPAKAASALPPDAGVDPLYARSHGAALDALGEKPR